jgi:hypothetical protein
VSSRFIPTADIRAIERDGNQAVRLRCRTGPDEVLRSAAGRRSAAATRDRDALIARLLEARDAYRSTRGASAEVVASLLARSGKPIDEWRRALDELRAEADYRRATVREEDLWQVVEDPHAPADVRAGAAVVLRPTLDATGRERVRVAAEATASPKLRIALDAVSSGDDDKLGVALSDVESDAAGTTSAPRRLAE